MNGDKGIYWDEVTGVWSKISR